MPIHYEFLVENSFSTVYRTFVEAFSDYALDMSYMSEESFYNRAIKNGIDFKHSIGAFDGERMIGFTLVGVDQWKGLAAAFDIATGITAPYRGRAIAGEMLRVAVDRLRDSGCKRFVLEVLQDNDAAIRSYRKIGFKIVRELDCYELVLGRAAFDKQLQLPVYIHPIERAQLNLAEAFLDWQPSWENSFASLNRIPDRLLTFGAIHQGGLIGAVAYYPALRWVVALAVEARYRRQGVATRLLESMAQTLQTETPAIKIVNVQRDDEAMAALLTRSGFEVYVRQYEMVLSI
jgi:ribosomal protein S18 acetylase RimI-like enzyme